MKTVDQLQDELDILLQSSQVGCDQLDTFKVQKTGDIVADFFTFTHCQGGGKSQAKDDPYILNGGHFPPEPDTDGQFYHTRSDVTWDTYHTILSQKTSADFYADDIDDNKIIVDYYIKAGKSTASDVVNILLSFCVWGTGNDIYDLKNYQDWYGASIADDVTNSGETPVFIRLIDLRKWELSQINSPANQLGWLRGLLNFYKLFKQYLS